jgi:hypothetical protein
VDRDDTSEQLYRGVAGFALLIGIGALFAPKALVRLYGADPDEMTGLGAMGWRLFAIRQLWTAGLALSGDQRARDAILIIQPPDLVVFAHCYRTRSIPRVTSVMAMISAGAVALLSALARSKR